MTGYGTSASHVDPDFAVYHVIIDDIDMIPTSDKYPDIAATARLNLESFNPYVACLDIKTVHSNGSARN